MIDELPLVALLGACAEGVTRVRGAQELRHKESDRIATVVEGMRALGATIEATEDGFEVEGAARLPRRHDRLARRPSARDARRGRRPLLVRRSRGAWIRGRARLLPRLCGRSLRAEGIGAPLGNRFTIA